MFAFFNRSRRHVAVLAALAMLASVLVAAPAVAADPEPNYEATFDACGDAPSAGFTDVPAAHRNAGDIDCIAYYGITKGTSATTYSPNMSVTREHMALFLIRLAGLVGIDIPSAGDTGFSDTAELSANSQAAISQLRQLGITQGTSDTTYSPADSVTRGDMALFVTRLMNLMTPLTDGDPSLDDTVFYGYTPSLVDDNEKVTVKNEDDEEDPPEIKAPFTDLGPVSKNQYDAITQLYELSVASGVSATAYAPSASMTRASMAGFIAAMLDHSSARPAGVSVQADKTSGYGEYVATVLVSVRTDEFGAMSDQLVDIFQNNCVDSCDKEAHFITSGDDAGQCNGKQTQGDCTWNTDDAQTDGNGNIFYGADIGDTPEVDGDTSKTHTVYAWIGEDAGDEFNVDENDYASVSASWTPARDAISASTSINKEAANGSRVEADQSQQLVNLTSTRSVVVTGQLIDEDNDDVARGGVEITIGLTRTDYENAADTNGSMIYENSEEAVKTTNDDGKVTIVVNAPRNVKSDEDQDVVHTVTFTADNGATMGDVSFNWIELAPTYQKTETSGTEYVLVDGDGDDDDDATVSVTVRLYDQYGNGIRQNAAGDAYIVTATLVDTGHATDYDEDEEGRQTTKTPSVSSSSSRRGMARALFAVDNIEASAGAHTLTVNFMVHQLERNADGELVDDDDDGNPDIATDAVDSDVDAVMTDVYVEAKASDGDDKQVEVAMIFGKTDDSPTTHFATAGDGNNHGVLYAVDDNDTYIENGETPAPCVTLRPDVTDMVRVILYSADSDDLSIFDINPTTN